MKIHTLVRFITLSCLAAGFWGMAQPSAFAVSFNPPPDNPAPGQSTGGASRSGFQFTPPDDHPAPGQTTGGASRGDTFFIPLPENPAPRQTYGGASREGAFIPPPDNATPTRTAAGASRTGSDGTGADGDFFVGSATSMLAMTPSNFYGLTVLERPTFMAYIPASTFHQAIFRLKDETQTVVYEQVLPMNREAGIVAIQLPEEAPALNVGQYYQWFVTVQTDEYVTPASPFVEAWIKRVEPTNEIAQTMAMGDAIAAAEALAGGGIWYDSLAILAEQQGDQTQVNRAQADHWTELLSSVGLGNLASVPVFLAPSAP